MTPPDAFLCGVAVGVLVAPLLVVVAIDLVRAARLRAERESAESRRFVRATRASVRTPVPRRRA